MNNVERKLVEETGFNITKETIDFIKYVEQKSYPEEMLLMEGAESLIDIAYRYGMSPLHTTIVRNIDWYIMYEDKHSCIVIQDIASLPNRDVEKSRQEMHDYITEVINKKAHNDLKPVVLSAKEDTSYKMIKRMVDNNEYKILEDIEDTWNIDNDIIMHDLILEPILKNDKKARKI